MAEHKVRVDGGLPGVRTGKRVRAVATCSCGTVARGSTRKAAVKNIKHKQED